MRYELPIGERLPLHLGAGKVQAAYMPEDEIAGMLEDLGPITTAAGKEVDLDGFVAEMARIRREGHATAISERVAGASSVSAPVLDKNGACIGAVQVAGRSEDIDPDTMASLVIEVRQAAAAIGERFG